MHGNASAASLDDTDQLRDLGSRRHEIDDRHLAVLGLEDGFEHQGARTVATVDLAYATNGSDQPSAVLRGAQKGGEACARIKTG
jgi:hypothetical protein